MQIHLTRRHSCIAALLSLLLIVSCAVNPVTGERELALISEAQEIQIGRDADRDVQNALGFVDDQDLQDYVTRIGLELARDSERPDLPWAFHVVDDPTPNAFALPGGFIYVTRGLMNLMSSEAELAAVLGHEIGHVTARHSVNQMSRAQLAQIGVGLGAVFAPELLDRFGGLTDLGLNLLFLRYGRDDERQADELGFEYMLANRFDVREMEHVFASLQAAGKLQGASPVPGWLASHPSEPERIETARQRAGALTAGAAAELRVNRNEYLAEIDGLAYGTDPREGFFEGDMFYHPELAFQFRVPEQWNKRNLPSAVIAQSPEQNAALQLTLVPNATLQTAAEAFFRQPGVQAAASSETTVNGKPALVSRFQGRTEAGDVMGIVAHIASSDSAAFRLVVYSTPTTAPEYEALFVEIVESFAPLTDKDILARQAPRVMIVRLDADMTVDEFARRYPSKISVDELAVINHVAGADSKLSADTEVKRVV